MAALLRERHIAHLATVNPDGSPQVSPVWVDTDGEAILINTAKGRLKHRNLLLQPVASISLVDASHPYSRTLFARGPAEIIEEGALEHMDQLSRKYDGKAWEPREGEVRVIIRVVPTRVSPAN